LLSIRELKAKCIDLHPEDVWTYKVIRPLSCYPTWACIKLGITANQVTLFNFLVGLSGCVLLTMGTYISMVSGALLVNLNYLLDRVDGNIAKTTNTVTKTGQLLDTFSDYLIELLIPVCLGIGLYFNPAFGIPSVVYLLLGFTYAIITTLRLRMASFASSIMARSTLEVVEPDSIMLKGGLIIIALEPILLLGFALGNVLGIFLLGYTLIGACELLVFTAMALRRVRRDDVT